LFSFGFTSFKSACVSKVEIIEISHSCCKVKTEQSKSHKHLKGDCCSTDSCQGSCCIESGDYLQFTDFVFQVNTIEVDNLEILSRPSLHHFLLSLSKCNIDLFQDKLIVPPDLFVHTSTSHQIILSKQAWLI